MAGMPTIRDAVLDDLSALEAAERECFADPWNREQLRASLESASTSCCVVHLPDAGLVGYCVFTVVADQAELQSVAVRPAWRRRGIGSLLLEHVCARARGDGAARVWLEVREGNTAAVALYRTHGFRQTGVRQGYYADGENAFMMACDV